MYGHRLVTDHSPTEGTCDNCGRDDADLAAVRRLYVQPETWDSPGKVTTTEDVERWCFSCRTQYPHEDAD